MADDAGLAQLLRDELAAEPVVKTKMISGRCFIWRRLMPCGVHMGGGGRCCAAAIKAEIPPCNAPRFFAVVLRG